MIGPPPLKAYRHTPADWLLAAIPLLLAASLAHADTTIDPTSKHAWTPNAGWTNFEGDVTDGVVTSESYLSGYAWSANTGWINFGDGSPENGHTYANTSAIDCGVNHDGAGNLSGYAWSPNTGWLNFGAFGPTNTNRPRISLTTGTFTGYAWSPNIGWFSLGSGSLATTSLDCPDTDSDGIADSWEKSHFASLDTISDLTDHDGDGTGDLDEYQADTDPDDPGSRFRITDYTFAKDIGKMSIRFTSSPSRLYRIYHSTNPDISWHNTTLGLFAPTNTSTTNKTFIIPIAESSFFRVESIKPLQP